MPLTSRPMSDNTRLAMSEMSSRCVGAAMLLLVGAFFIASAIGAWRLGVIKGGKAAHSPLRRIQTPKLFTGVVGFSGLIGAVLAVLGVYLALTGRLPFGAG